MTTWVSLQAKTFRDSSARTIIQVLPNLIPQADAMDHTRWHTINEVFHAACELPPAERAAYVSEACAGDAALERAVHDLLDGDVHGAGLLDGVVGDAMAEYSEPDQTDRAVGPYRIIREIGRGGMGAVFLAQRVDGQFDQRVALKLVKPGMDSDQILRRFRSERQILAGLEHPNIARLLDGGATDEGRPYFALEYVEGEPIDVYCNNRSLDVDARLALFQDVCRAVMHAHSRLIVHRDLKPANIMVGADGQVKLLDFGLARLLTGYGSDATLTRFGMRPITPAYAAPEHVRGEEVGTAADVYSLGVVLYELLTGVRPYDVNTHSAQDVERVVCHTEPERPSMRLLHATDVDSVRLRRRLAGDLDMICMMALRKEPTRRYPSVESLLHDIDRTLTGKPVTAQPDTLRYRAGKFVLRHRSGIAVAAGVVLTIGLVIAFYTARVTAERDRARVEAAKAEQVAGFLQELFEVANPWESAGETVTARELLDAGAARIEVELAGQPEVQASLMRVIGVVYQGLGLHDQARPLFERALAQMRELYGDEHAEVATSEALLGVLLQDMGDRDAAESLLLHALQTRRQLLGNQHADVSEVMMHLANFAERGGDVVTAERIAREAFEIEQRTLPPGDSRLAASMIRLGGFLRLLDRPDEAEPLLREGLRLQRAAYGDRNLQVAAAARNLGALLRDLDRFDEAAALYEDALATRRSLLGPAHHDVISTLNSYNVLLLRMGATDSALVIAAAAVSAAEQAYVQPHPTLAATYSNYAAGLLDAGRLDEAEPLYIRSIQVVDSVTHDTHPNRAFPRMGLADVYMQQGRFADAERPLREAVELRRAGLPEGHRYTGESLSDLGECLTTLGRYAEAREVLTEALAILTAAEGSDSRRAHTARERLEELDLAAANGGKTTL